MHRDGHYRDADIRDTVDSLFDVDSSVVEENAEKGGRSSGGMQPQSELGSAHRYGKPDA